MAAGTIVASWQTGNTASVAVWVDEGAKGRVEYIASIDVTIDLKEYGFEGKIFSDLTTAQKRQLLLAIITRIRNNQVAPSSSLGLSGSVTV